MLLLLLFLLVFVVATVVFMIIYRVNLSGGIISKKTMKPYLDAWIKASVDGDPILAPRLFPLAAR